MSQTEADPPTPQPLWTVKDVSRFLKRSPRWISYYLARTETTPGSIPHFRLPGRAVRFDPAEIMDWVREGCPPAGTLRAWRKKNRS